MYACAFTGHRPSHFIFRYDESHPLCRAIKDAILSECRRLYENEAVRTFYSGAALGVDLWGAEAVLSLRSSGYTDIRLVCAIPFPNHDEKWPTEQKRRLARIMKSSDESLLISETYSGNDVYTRRNYFMVDRTQFLIAVYDYRNPNRSGTMQTVNYANQNNKKIIFVNPNTAEVTY